MAAQDSVKLNHQRDCSYSEYRTYGEYVHNFEDGFSLHFLYPYMHAPSSARIKFYLFFQCTITTRTFYFINNMKLISVGVLSLVGVKVDKRVVLKNVLKRTSASGLRNFLILFLNCLSICSPFGPMYGNSK